MNKDLTKLENLDVAFINPSVGSNYQSLKNKYTSIEPPTWSLLLAESMRNFGFKVSIIDANAENLDFEGVFARIEKLTFDTRINLGNNLPDKLTHKCDSHFMARVFQNLIGNALKYATTQVKVTLLAEQQWILFIVEDDGAGIAQIDRESIFKPFTRLDKSRDKKTGGFGLGLAIVCKIVSWHQGECKVEDSELGGAKFIISLPIKK